jgi:hypothetical protein
MGIAASSRSVGLRPMMESVSLFDLLASAIDLITTTAQAHLWRVLATLLALLTVVYFFVR